VNAVRVVMVTCVHGPFGLVEHSTMMGLRAKHGIPLRLGKESEQGLAQ
jgi:hypothetical protein